MDESIEDRFLRHYTPCVGEFVRLALANGNIDTHGIPQPHFPRWGSEYEKADLRIVFIGKETRSDKKSGTSWGSMNEFLHLARRDIKRAILPSDDTAFRDLEFKDWTNNSGATFWDTSLRILAAIHSLQDWKELKTKSEHDRILREIGWANTNCVESWGATAAGQGADYNTWHSLKTLSEQQIDSFPRTLDVFRPHLAIVMHGPAAAEYWKHEPRWDKIPSATHIWFADDKNYRTRIYWTYHPGWLNRNKLLASTIETIARHFRETSPGSVFAGL